MLAVLILSKFVVVAVISMALAAISAGTGDGLSGLLTGGALLLIAAAAPFTLLRMVPIIEAGMIGHLEGAGRRAISPPRALQQQVEQRVVNQLLEDRGAPPVPGPGSDGPVEERAATSRSERGLDADGTQGGSGKPVPVGRDASHGVAPGAPGAPGAPASTTPGATTASSAAAAPTAATTTTAAAAAGPVGVAAAGVAAATSAARRVEASPSVATDALGPTPETDHDQER
jgi:hypothetical protein